MSNALERKIARFHHRVRLLAAAYGLCALVTGAMAAMIALGLLDYLLRYEDRGLRIFASLAWLATWIWLVYRYLYLPAAVRLSNVDLAIQLQRHFPDLADRLASAVDFCGQEKADPMAGSPALRGLVIEQTTAEVENLDFNQAIDPRPMLRELLLCGAICALSIILAWLDPGAARTAVTRLINPLNNVSWPQKNSWAISPPPAAPQPPRIESLSIRLFPPSYTGWPPEKAEKQIRALVGTRLEIEGRASKPLQKAVLCLEEGREFSGNTSDDGLEISCNDSALTVEKSGSYWFSLTDAEGILGGENERWEISAVADNPPGVTIERPTADLYVTPQAVVPLRIAAKDDLSIREVDLVFGQSAAETIVTVYVGPQQMAAQPTGSLSQLNPSGQQRVVEYRWQLEPLRLVPGRELVFQAQASDYKGQTTRSQPRRLFVVSPRELQDRIAGRQHLLAVELDRALKLQRAARAQVEAVRARLDDGKQLDQTELDRLRAAELGQRRVKQIISGSDGGVLSHVFAMQDDLENNRLENQELRRQLDAMQAEIERLTREHLPVINRELISAWKSAEVALGAKSGPTRAGAEIAAALTVAEKDQDKVIAALEKMLAQYAQGDSARRFASDLSRLLGAEEEIAARTAEVGRRTLGKDLNDLTPQEAAESKELASRQYEHAQSLDKILQDLENAVAELQRDDRLAAESAGQALNKARQLEIDELMRACGDNLRQNQLGQAARRQKTILENLQEILDILSRRKGEESVGEKLGRWEDAVKALYDRQQNAGADTRHWEELRQAQGQFTRAQLAELRDLVRLQRELQTDVLALGRQTKSAPFSFALLSAGRNMDQAAELLEKDLTGKETQEAQHNALRRLEFLQEALKSEANENQKDMGEKLFGAKAVEGQQGQITSEKALSLAELKLLKMLQEEVNGRTAALAKAVGPDGKANEEQRRQYAQLAEEQNQLAELILKMMNEK